MEDLVTEYNSEALLSFYSWKILFFTYLTVLTDVPYCLFSRLQPTPLLYIFGWRLDYLRGKGDLPILFYSAGLDAAGSRSRSRNGSVTRSARTSEDATFVSVHEYINREKGGCCLLWNWICDYLRHWCWNSCYWWWCWWIALKLVLLSLGGKPTRMLTGVY